MTSYNDLSVHELLDICYSIVIGQSLDVPAVVVSNNKTNVKTDSGLSACDDQPQRDVYR